MRTHSLRATVAACVTAAFVLLSGGVAAAAPYYPSRIAEGVYEIRLARQSLWVGVPNGAIGIGARVALADTGQASAQRWRVVAAQVVQRGGVGGSRIVDAYRLINLNSSKCLDIQGPDTRNYIAVHQWVCKPKASYHDNPANSQQWKVTRDSQGQSELINVYSGKCLDVPEFRAYPGRLMQQWSCSGAWNQAFRLTRVG